MCYKHVCSAVRCYTKNWNAKLKTTKLSVQYKVLQVLLLGNRCKTVCMYCRSVGESACLSTATPECELEAIYISDVVWHVCTNCKQVLRKFGGKNRVTSLCFHMGPNYTPLPHCFSFSLYHIMLLILSRVISFVFFIIISVFSFLLPVGICLCFASAWRRPGWQLPRMLCDFQSITVAFPQFTFPP